MKVLIVGGVAGGASAAARLRRLDEDLKIILFERGEYISFANCGLPYYIGDKIKDKGLLTLQTPESFNKRFNVDVRNNSEVISIDPAKKTVLVNNNGKNYEESYDKLILSMGAEPFRLNILGEDLPHVFTLRNIPDTYKIKEFIDKNNPKTAVVVGGGYIGVEMAENLKNLGLEVTILEMSDQIIPPIDFDMACDIQNYMKEKGINLLLNTELKEITPKEAMCSQGRVLADMVILSVGVKPESKLASNAGIKVNNKGSIVVSNTMETNIKDIYGVGDVVEVSNFVTNSKEFIPLAGPANKQGRIAADNICKIPSSYSGTQGSSILKLFDMTIATTGINEKTAKSLKIDYDKTYTFSPSHATYYPNSNNMSIKVLWDKKTYRILGAQIVGFDGVDKRIDVIATAIRLKGKITDLAELELCYAPPFSSAKDPVNMVGFVASNVISKMYDQFFWHDICNLPRDGSVTLLDVRTDMEVKRGKIEGFVHIPLDSLRKNLDKIPDNRPVYIHCHSGLRSYIACRILQTPNRKCFNLAGGYRLYDSVIRNNISKEYICNMDK